MAFTTSTVSKQERYGRQFQSNFSDVWQVTATIDPASIAAGAEDTGTLTVTGLALGDMIIGWAPGVDITIDASVSVWVSAANTITIAISNLDASVALDLGSSTWKFLVGRPAF